MPKPNRPYPYGMTYKDLEPEPSIINRDHDSLTVSKRLAALSTDSHWVDHHDEMERIFDAGLALAMRMTLDPEYSHLSRGQILAIALDTAIVWERG